MVSVEPLRYSPDEFANLVREEVEQHGTRMIVLDSLAGYNLSMLGSDLTRHLHALIRFLSTRGVSALVLSEVESVTGDFRITDMHVSYLADNIIFLRYLEMNGQMRKAIGVLKEAAQWV